MSLAESSRTKGNFRAIFAEEVHYFKHGLMIQRFGKLSKPKRRKNNLAEKSSIALGYGIVQPSSTLDSHRVAFGSE